MFQRFADFECTQDPLYVALCHAIAADTELLALMDHAPATQRRPNLLLAALHERVLADGNHPLRAYYPSAGGQRLPDPELPRTLRDFAERERAPLIAHLRQKSTQTNEIGRCAILWPALNWIARQQGTAELALFDFGSSAGLNLGVDAYRYDYGGFTLGAADGPRVRCEWHGAAPPPEAGVRIVQRLGVDPAAIDVRDEDAVRWLRACLWPHDRERAARLDAAVALARARAWQVRRTEDGLAALAAWLDTLPPAVQPVLFNSWVLTYLSPARFAQHRERVAALVRDRDLVELSAELAALGPAGLQVPPPPTVKDPQSPTLWTVQSRRGVHPLAWSHGHGRWVEWLG
jgi:hypothetical protein